MKQTNAAPIEYLFAFGEKYPEEQRKYPIIGLGSVAKVLSDHCVPFPDRSDAERDLCLGWWWDDGCGGCYRFVAIRTPSSVAPV
jgi:hypothetical protein